METFMKNAAITLVVSIYTCSIFFMGTIVQEGDKAYTYMEYVFIATLIGFPVFEGYGRVGIRDDRLTFNSEKVVNTREMLKGILDCLIKSSEARSQQLW